MARVVHTNKGNTYILRENKSASRSISSKPQLSKADQRFLKRSFASRKKHFYVDKFNGVFRIIFFCLFFYAILFTLTNADRAENISFHWFLQLLQNAPSVDMSWLFASDNLLLNDWGVFEWAKLPFNWITDLLRPFGLIAHGIAQLAVYIGYFLYSIFGVIGG